MIKKKHVTYTVSVVIFAVLSWLLYFANNQNNVCKTFGDYYTNRDTNKNCYHNPDFKLEVPDIIRRKAYPIKTYQVTTDDGYILTLFRIPEGKNTKNIARKPVFLQHGLNHNSASFVNNGNESLAFVLADAGYDVWLGNFRGTVYSKQHKHLKPSSKEFWNFTLNEYGVRDVAAQLNFIKSATKEKVIFIGYSVGATAALVYGSTFPDEAEQNIEILISLAPVVFIRDTRLMAYLTFIWPLYYANHTGSTYSLPYVTKDIIQMLCLPYPFQFKLCQLVQMLFGGINFNQSNPETVPITLVQNYDLTAAKVYTHYNQIGLNNKFQRFDYGDEINDILYKKDKIPEYDLSKIKFMNFIIRAPNDLMATQKNIELLRGELPQDVKTEIYVIQNEKFSHYDFLTAKDAKSLVYDVILKFVDDNL